MHESFHDPRRAQMKLKAALRLVLWNQGRGLNEVAELWGCTEAQARDQLGETELPLGRLLLILDWLGMSLTDLQMLAASDRTIELLRPPQERAQPQPRAQMRVDAPTTIEAQSKRLLPATFEEHFISEPTKPASRVADQSQILLRRTDRMNLLRNQETNPGLFEKLFRIFAK